MRLRIVLLLLSTCLSLMARAQIVMQGRVTDIADGKPVANVNIENIYTRLGTVTDSSGKFSLTVARGELIEFRKIGYKIARVRIPQGNVPPYFKIIMEKGAVELPEFTVRDKYRDYKTDSVRYYETYKRELEFPALTGLDVIRHPFSALSKRNRRIWAFQKEYDTWEKQKFIDYTFNEKLITHITGLQGDSLQEYRLRYRPTYEMLRNFSDYDYYLYIKQSAEHFRNRR